MQCDICGKNEELVVAHIEGANLTVCMTCAKFGKIISRAPVKSTSTKSMQKPISKSETVIQQDIVSDYGDRIKKKRESLGLKQIELAKKLAEKESTIHKLESQELKPSIELARKLEKILSMKLIEEYLDAPDSTQLKHTDSSNSTIGDMIHIKNRKK